MPANILLMTATIRPREDTIVLLHSDPDQRMDDYVRALTFYLGELEAGTFDRIVFVENSESDLSGLQRLAADTGLADRCDFVPVARGPIGEHGRFYLELDLLKKGFATRLVGDLPDDSMMWKVTGRYIVRNIGRIVRTAPDVDVYVNSRDHPVRWTDFYLLAFRKRLFDVLLGDQTESYDTSRAGEEIWREFIDRSEADGMSVRKRMEHVPDLAGTRGFDKMNYGGIGYTIKRYVRTVAHKVAPSFWF